ncbi:MAG TPA: hypothetical protein VGF67_23030 [Ktedonobacteraceae bacterium]
MPCLEAGANSRARTTHRVRGIVCRDAIWTGAEDAHCQHHLPGGRF